MADLYNVMNLHGEEAGWLHNPRQHIEYRLILDIEIQDQPLYGRFKFSNDRRAGKFQDHNHGFPVHRPDGLPDEFEV